ncbi:zinc finger, CCHC-type containing protein [Tanacetum coccineum]
MLLKPDYAYDDSNFYRCARLRLAFDPTKTPNYKVIKYIVDTDEFMTPLHEEWSIRSIVWSIVLGEREEDSFLVINLSRKVVQYNLISKTLCEIYDMRSNKVDYDYLHGFIPPFAMYDMGYKKLDHKELKIMFSQQADQELLHTVRAFHVCKHEEVQSVSSYFLEMKSYIDNLERLGHPMSLILATLSKKDVAPALHAIRAGNGKSKLAYAPAYVPKPKIPPPPKEDNPVKDSICPKCSETGHWRMNCPQYLAVLMKKKKLSQGASTSRFLKETMGYSFYYPLENKVLVARNAKFFKNSLITQEESGILEDLEIIQDEYTHPSKNTIFIMMRMIKKLMSLKVILFPFCSLIFELVPSYLINCDLYPLSLDLELLEIINLASLLLVDSKNLLDRVSSCTSLFSLSERLKANNKIRVDQLVTILLIESSIYLLDQNRYPVDTSLIHIESRKSPTIMLFDVDTGRISIRHYEYLRVSL